MKNIAFDGTTILKFNAGGADGALDAATDCDGLRNDAAFDSAEDMRWTIAFDFADDRHAGADARVRSRFKLRPQPCFICSTNPIKRPTIGAEGAG